MCKNLTNCYKIVESRTTLFFLFSVIGVILNLNQPITQLDLTIQNQDVLGMNVFVDDIVTVQILNTLKQGEECIDEFLFRKEVPIEGSFAVIELQLHIRVSLRVQQTITVEERS